MFSILFKYNIILIVLCIGMELIHNSSQTITEAESLDSIEKRTNASIYISLRCSIDNPSCRSVLLTAKALGLEISLLPIDLLHGEQLDHEFLEIHIEHTLPTKQKDTLVLSESHAIILYLVQKYGGENNQLYTNDPKQQAKINKILYFNNGQLYPPFKNQYNPWMFKGVPKTEEAEKEIHVQLGYLETYLESSTFAAGESVTVADMALVPSILTFEAAGVVLTEYTKINAWLERCKNEFVGYDEANQIGFDEIKKKIALRNTIETSNISLYYSLVNPPCRSVLLTAKALHLEFDLRPTRILHGGQTDPELVKINFQHTLPTIQGDNFVLWKSNAIILYLVQTYGGENNPLYPNDPEKQARIKKILYFNNELLYTSFKNQYNPWISEAVPKTDENKIHKQLEYLEKCLESSTFAAGESVTVADMALVTSISTFEVVGIELKNYPKISEWLAKCKKVLVGYEKANQMGIDEINKIRMITESTKVSPKCRSILLTLIALNIGLNELPIEFIEHASNANTSKLSFTHTSPRLQIDDKLLVDSHAIIMYLVNEYKKEKNLQYTKDQYNIVVSLLRLNEDLCNNFIYQYNPWIFFNKEKINAFEHKIHEPLRDLELHLKKLEKPNTWAAGGDSPTAADIALVATISTFEVAGVSLLRYSTINAWLEKCKKELVGYKEANQNGIDIIKKYVDERNKMPRTTVYKV